MQRAIALSLNISIFLVISSMFCSSKFPNMAGSSRERAYTGNSYDWATSTPEEQGLDPDLLRKAFKEAKKKSYYFSLLVVKNGYLVAEEYYNERDKDNLDNLYSVTKSFMSALIGIAIQEGYIDSLNQKFMDFFPEYDSEYLDPRKREITIRHIMTMQAGFDTEENIWQEMNLSSNMIASIIWSELQFDPGTKFLYSTHGSHLLSGIITKSTGMSTFDYAMDKLFNPIGVTSMVWIRDQNDINFGGASSYLTPRDMARFGYLYLQKGFLDQKQVIPSEWIELSVQNHRDYTEPWKEMSDVGYGFQWWTGQFDQYSIYFASGFGGQWILNIPDLDMVIVSTMNAYSEDNWHQMESLITIIDKYILPAAM